MGATEGHKEGCCCNHGGRCSCAFKNDLDTVPETSGAAEEGTEEEHCATATAGDNDATGPTVSGAPAGATTGNAAGPTAPVPVAAAPTAASGSTPTKTPVRRRRANTTRSEGTLSFDEHGRHKPVSQKHAKAAVQKTNPYPISRARSSRATSRANHVDDELDDKSSNGAPESSSNGKNAGCCSSGTADSTAGGKNETTSHPAQLGQQQQHRPPSEATSPVLFASSFPQVPPPGSIANDLPVPLSASMTGSYNTNDNNIMALNAFTQDQMDQSIFSVGVSEPSVDWSQFGLDFDRGFSLCTDDKLATAKDFGFTKSFGYEFNGSELAPTMTTATSGDVSEAEDALFSGLDDYEFDYDYDYDAFNDTASNSVTFSRTNSGFNLPASISSANVRSHTISGDMSELRFWKAGKDFLSAPLPGVTDEMVTLQLMTGTQLQGTERGDDEPMLWMHEDNGMPPMVESPESDALSFWDRTQ
ncbi:transcriptional activator haa1 [Sporothrix epigloea]|uniref:Transcriptional activator haa1 n=1 Tax=Sporothrix epigloea TaxID=1892477 RepID=A0ABP0D317_9PEZI